MAGARTSSAKAESLYGVTPGVAMMQKWIAGLKEKTGRTLEEWVALIQREGPKDEIARKEWLKTKHKLGTNSAWFLAERADGRGDEEDSPEKYLKTAVEYVEDQYSGPKEKLRPIYHALLKLGKSMGTDAKACPCKTMVPFYRNHVFAQIKPTTNTRVDIGFALTHYKGKLSKRLIDTGGLAKKDRITHRIELTSVDQIDDEVKKWMKTAYELDAK
ncbi:MAG TPA: DUF5655 domain-containing protein [Candidatus Methylomirabilis sp.]|nr:DUF5655 domain-containing protein [Candidatus Methylomirabilis sp.]